MAQNNHPFSMEDAQRLAQSEVGQKLMTLLQSQNATQLQTAMQQASSGDYAQLKKTIGTLMASPEARALLKQLENSQHE
jgi:hypothetical protein